MQPRTLHLHDHGHAKARCLVKELGREDLCSTK
jgi:hypothetical protein